MLPKRRNPLFFLNWSHRFALMLTYTKKRCLFSPKVNFTLHYLSCPPTQFVLGPSSSFRPGVFFGFVCDDSGETMVGKGMDDDAHILISGGSGQGKTQGIVIPTMATWAGSQIVLDIKGELLAFHAQLPRKRTMVFSPECLDGNSCLYDPIFRSETRREKCAGRKRLGPCVHAHSRFPPIVWNLFGRLRPSPS